MAPRKEHWAWKERGCPEVKGFTPALAMKEYVQNVVGEVLKELEVREWSEWVREDLRSDSVNEQQARKLGLIQSYPGLLTGPHGASIKRLETWLSLYILWATIPALRLKRQARPDLHAETDTQLQTNGHYDILDFNNHMDPNADFATFAIDGASTSRETKYAVGHKGKGFILATQFFLEHVEEVSGAMKEREELTPGVSFRVGQQIGTLKWKKTLLEVIVDDLTLSIEQYLAQRGTYSVAPKTVIARS
ncbi:hypothetical protein MVEN_00719000 [Mycena venus]|uniref:Uncharacterized protein n=1 Tax=Mycena venus TaxID=2733690 RepID=A0A8H6YEZ1_9AGAR|nr:hypothetical protein MVEN_00719000 [Mycena venus]